MENSLFNSNSVFQNCKKNQFQFYGHYKTRMQDTDVGIKVKKLEEWEMLS